MQLITQQLIKTNNLKRIYQIVANQKTISRAKLSSVTGLSKTTVSALVDELIETRYLNDLGVGESERIGRKPNALQINSDDNFVATMSLHKRYLRAALVNTAGEVCYCKVISFTHRNYVEYCRNALYDELLPQLGSGRLLGVCLVFPAMIDHLNNRMVSTVLDISQEDNIIAELREGIRDYPVAIFNDTACYAYAELINNKLQEHIFTFVNVNKGIGAILLDNGKMFRGANGMTTQFGHFSVDRNGPVCSCGNRGCLEHMVGETVLARRAKECGIAEAFPQNGELLFAAVGQMAAAGSPEALQLMQVLAKDLAYALSNLISMFHPELVVIGGTGVNLGVRFLELLHSEMSTIGFPNFMSDVKVRFTELSQTSELEGAATYYLDKYLSFDGEMTDRLFLV